MCGCLCVLSLSSSSSAQVRVSLMITLPLETGFIYILTLAAPDAPCVCLNERWMGVICLAHPLSSIKVFEYLAKIICYFGQSLLVLELLATWAFVLIARSNYIQVVRLEPISTKSIQSYVRRAVRARDSLRTQT